jgi:hypothetical protein
VPGFVAMAATDKSPCSRWRAGKLREEMDRRRLKFLPIVAVLMAGLLRVTLRAQPSDSAIAVHPLVDFGFAFETLNVDRLDIRILG